VMLSWKFHEDDWERLTFRDLVSDMYSRSECVEYELKLLDEINWDLNITPLAWRVQAEAHLRGVKDVEEALRCADAWITEPKTLRKGHAEALERIKELLGRGSK
jgi:hypothetical protein